MKARDLLAWNNKATPVLWIDLDGTVRLGKDEMGKFVHKPEDVVIFDGVPDILLAYKQAGWRIVAVSNQGGIATGKLTMAECLACMERTHSLCEYVFDKIAWCSHHPDAEEPEMRVCWCRKPRIGLIVDMANDLGGMHREYYPPALGGFVGDRPEDEQCAANAGLRFMWAKEWRDGGWKEWIKP